MPTTIKRLTDLAADLNLSKELENFIKSYTETKFNILETFLEPSVVTSRLTGVLLGFDIIYTWFLALQVAKEDLSEIEENIQELSAMLLSNEVSLKTLLSQEPEIQTTKEDWKKSLLEAKKRALDYIEEKLKEPLDETLSEPLDETLDETL